MIAIAAFGRQVQHIIGIGHLPAHPVFDLFAEAALHSRVIAPFIRLAEIAQARAAPIAHRYTHGVLVHSKMLASGEMQAAFPTITEAIGPLARIAVALMPHIFFCPQPALFAHRQNKLKHVGMTFAIHYALFNVEDKRPLIFQDSFEFAGYRKKPLDILVGRYPAISILALVCIGRRGDN